MTESLLTPQSTSMPKLDDTKNYVEELVGDGKKFKTVEDLARGKYEADLFIESKNRQFDALAEDYKRLRDEYNAGPKLQELIDKITQQPPSSSDNTQAKEPETKSTLTPDQLDSLFEDKLQQFEANKTRDTNFKIVKEKLQEKFGNESSQILANQIQKLGLTAEKVDDLARTSPAAFFRLMGLEENTQRDTFQAPPTSSTRSDTFAPRTQKRTWSYYKGMLKTQPNLFSDPKAHNQMMDDIKAIGEKDFYDVV